MDITTDGFGWMLTFGDLCWVPFTYTLQAKYLSSSRQMLGSLRFSLILGLQLFGYWIFRSSNQQKDTFRNNPSHPTVKGIDVFVQLHCIENGNQI
jgi:delta14-sterol reductase